MYLILLKLIINFYVLVTIYSVQTYNKPRSVEKRDKSKTEYILLTTYGHCLSGVTFTMLTLIRNGYKKATKGMWDGSGVLS